MNGIFSKLTNIHGKRLTLIEIAFVFLFPLLFRQFYNYVLVPDVICKLAVYCSVLISFAYSAKYLFLRKYKSGSIPQYVQWIFVAIFVSSFVAFVSRGQSLLLSYRVLTTHLLGYVYFFVLYKIKPHPKVIVRLIFCYAIIYALCYIWAMFNAPSVVFGDTEKALNEDRGTYRIRVGGLQFMVLLFFYSIVQIVKSYKWIILSVVTYILIVLSLTRQTIALTLLIAGLFLTWKKKWIRYTVIILAFIAFNLQNINIKFDDSSIIGSLINVTTTQVEEQGEEDVRIRAFKSFFSDFHQNFAEVMFGSGYSHVDSDYGKWEERNFLSKGFIRADVGYAGIYVTFGILGLCVFILMFYKALKLYRNENITFAHLFLWYMFITNITMWALRSFCIEISICLYLILIYRLPTLGKTSEQIEQ